MNSPKILIIKWSLWWLGLMGFYILILKPMGVSHNENTLFSNLYFILISIFSAKVYHVDKKLRDCSYLGKLLLFIVVSNLIFLILPNLLYDFFPLTAGTKDLLATTEFYFPLFELHITTVKIFDIIFQQVLIFALVMELKKFFESKRQIVYWFTISFLIIHLPLVFIFGWYSLIFIVPSLFAGILFSYLILNYQYGLLYSFIVHQIFYLGSGITIRVINI